MNRDDILNKVRDLGVRDNFLTRSIFDVIKGETIEETEVLNRKTGEMELVKRRKTRKPEDVARGLVIYDILTGGELGLASESLIPDSLRKKQPEEIFTKQRRLPGNVVDLRLVSDGKPLPESEDG